MPRSGIRLLCHKTVSGDVHFSFFKVKGAESPYYVPAPIIWSQNWGNSISSLQAARLFFLFLIKAAMGSYCRSMAISFSGIMALSVM